MNDDNRTTRTGMRPAATGSPDADAASVAPPPWRLGILTNSLQASAIDAVDSCALLGIDVLEVGVTAPSENEIWSISDSHALVERAAHAGIRLHSACGHVFNKIGFGDEDDSVRRTAVDILQQLLSRCHATGITTLLLPFFGAQALRGAADIERAVQTLAPVCPIAADLGVVLALETTLPAADWAAFVTALDHPSVGAYFDIGNSVGLGFDPASDLAILAPHLRGVHVKDRHHGVWDTTALGAGGVDFGAAFRALAQVGYSGPLVLETPVVHDPMADARGNLDFVRRYIGSVHPSA